jgi:hypothetical protein
MERPMTPTYGSFLLLPPAKDKQLSVTGILSPNTPALIELDARCAGLVYPRLRPITICVPRQLTFFNSGTQRPQLSSSFLATVPDDLNGSFKAIRDNSLLAKYSGGLGNDRSMVRGLGAYMTTGPSRINIEE